MTILTATEAKALLRAADDGFALPSKWYVDRDLFGLEREQVLRRGWHVAGHTGQLPAAGDQLATTVAGVPVVLVRDEERGIRGFVNICRHRAHPVVVEPCNRRVLQCGYHGWTYGLDGCLRNAPRAEGELDFDSSGFGLAPVQTATWGPMIWVNVSPSAPPFEEWTAGLPGLVAANGVDVAELGFAFDKAWDIQANWKVFLDNAVECYHCPTCHPELSRVLEMKPDLHDLSIGGRWWVSHSIPFRNADLRYHFHWVFPTTYVQYVVPGQGLDVGTVEVLDVDRIRFRHLVFLPPDMVDDEREARRLMLEGDPTIPQDVAICDRVQRSHAAGVAPPGRLLPRSEWLLQHFQRILIEMLVDA